MTRFEIVKRVNQKMYEGMYHFEDIKYDLDDAIIIINNTLNSKYPMMSEVLEHDNSEYTYYDEEIEQDLPIFPEQYINNVVIEHVVGALFRREGEFGNEYTTALGAHERGLSAMFRDMYDKVPENFIDEDTGVIPVNPFEAPLDE